MSPAAPSVEALFPTLVYRADGVLGAAANRALSRDLMAAAETDRRGQAWCERHGYQGYTSYAGITDLATAVPRLKPLERAICRHAAHFCRSLHWQTRGAKPIVDSLWVNILPAGGSHTSHIHTNAVLSGTYYVRVPPGSGALVFEDPRHALMMAAPPRRPAAPRAMATHVSVAPAEGTLLLWESWLRHEVALTRSAEPRISVSFNCVLG